MDKETHLQDLRQQYVKLSRDFLNELQSGKSFKSLEDLRAVILTLVEEIQAMEDAIEKDKPTGTKAV